MPGTLRPGSLWGERSLKPCSPSCDGCADVQDALDKWLTNPGPSLSPLDAVEETKPTESAQQEEVKEEESKADQENA